MVETILNGPRKIGFSKWYSKLEKQAFTTIRRYDHYEVGQVYLITTTRGAFYARLARKEKQALRDLPTVFLLRDTDCETREEALQLLNSFYRKPISEDEQLTILYLEKI